MHEAYAAVVGVVLRYLLLQGGGSAVEHAAVEGREAPFCDAQQR